MLHIYCITYTFLHIIHIIHIKLRRREKRRRGSESLVQIKMWELEGRIINIG